ncbi:hypothetical protein [Streptomyces minutiscleroticus]|uniref:Uncharacterized protein n=1 Tax=Streptomyces minutiscleroticus TaxID=68238 RepID=A0A918NYW8_9ACTN|nr:hypothetical protein [Streptomyces minutiscleroticus]GGY06608.1 hypothetical protein GCM10010358_69850 [Streptomyces minutiscleroticus]
MTSSTVSHHRRRAAAAAISALLLFTAAVVLLLVAGTGLQENWLPHAGQAFAADTTAVSASASHSVDGDPCDLVLGPAQRYCLREAGAATAGAGAAGAGAAWQVLVPSAGLAVLLLWRWRDAVRNRRR